MDQQHNYHSIMLFLDRGLQSPALADVLATISSCASYVEEMPFPIVVNAVLIRLAEAFQGEKFSSKLEQFLNVVRLSIVKAVCEFRQYLHVALSSDELVRCIMKVSHSNDFQARSLTLLFLAALAPLISENKKAHHLLIESLDCSENTELSAGIYAVTEFGKHSVTFASLVVQKISEILCSNQTNDEIKLKLLNVISSFKESSVVIQTCFQLVNRLLKFSDNKNLHMAVYNASTTLATRCPMATKEQISLLLTDLEKITPNNVLTYCLLKNLARLSVFPHQWQSNQVTMLRNMFNKINEKWFKKLLCTWLKCLKALTDTGLHCDVIIEKDFSWIILLKSDNLILRINGIQLLLNLMNKTSAKHLHGVFLLVVKLTINDIKKQVFEKTDEVIYKENYELKQTKKLFYKSISTFSKMVQCGSDEALLIVKELINNCSFSLLNFLKKEELTNDNFNKELNYIEYFNLVLQTLCAICDSHPTHCSEIVSQWSFNQFLNVFNLFPNFVNQIPFALYNLILAPTLNKSFTKHQNVEKNNFYEEMEIDEIKQNKIDFNLFFLNIKKLELVQQPNIQNFINFCDLNLNEQNGAWIQYKIARCALRYGHWKNVALPILEDLHKLCDSVKTSLWINALINIAKSQTDQEVKFSNDCLNKTYKYLRNANLILKRLTATSNRDYCFNFAEVYTNCLALSWKAIGLLLSTLNVKLLLFSQMDNNGLPNHCIKQIHAALTFNQESITLAYQQWTVLYHKSFDADKHTLEQIELWIQFTLTIENILLFLCGQPISSFQIGNEINICTLGGKVEKIEVGTQHTFQEIKQNLSQCATNHYFQTVLLNFNNLLKSLQNKENLINNHNTSIEKDQKNTEKEIKVEKMEYDSEEKDVDKFEINNLLKKRLTYENLKSLQNAILNLKNFPFGLPRFFFQHIYCTQIKLNILPQARESDNNFINISTPLLPVTVEGVIQTNNLNKIHGITVFSEVHCVQNPSKSFVEKRYIELEENDNYFKTQFLIKITENVTKIAVKLLFTDSTSRRNWVDESATAELNVQYIDGKS